ncbi:MAG TPA: cytochrome P450 [Deltaproteobacteria bacterium]|jgi:cytochrome P450|nr:cytochrome P450 [Deltaproteobacteria bacterium]
MARPLEYDPYAYEVHEDPYPLYRALRDEAPLYKSEALEFWALSRHSDVLSALKDFETFSNRNGVSLDRDAFHPGADATMSFLAMDPPRHTRMRSLVSRGFTPRRVSDLEPRIRELAARYLDECAERGGCDFIADFAGKLPMDVISELLGLPVGDRAMLRGWADTVVHREPGLVGLPPAAAGAALQLLQYFQAHVAERRTRPRGDDLTEALLEAQIEGDRLSEREILGFLFLMVIAGNETTTKLLANALYWLWLNPEQRNRLRADPSLVPNWVEETARYDNSTQALARVVARDTELYGTRLHEGEKVVLLIGSANRDERAFGDPDRYDLLRNTRASLSFGHGTHFCLGAALARLEGRVALEEVWRRFPEYDVEPEGIVRVHSVNVRGFAALPVKF